MTVSVLDIVHGPPGGVVSSVLVFVSMNERAEAAQIPLHARAATQVVSVVKCL